MPKAASSGGPAASSAAAENRPSRSEALLETLAPPGPQTATLQPTTADPTEGVAESDVVMRVTDLSPPDLSPLLRSCGGELGVVLGGAAAEAGGAARRDASDGEGVF